MHTVAGQRGRRSHMQPVQRPRHPQAALIQMDHRRLGHLATRRLREGDPTDDTVRSLAATASVATLKGCPNRCLAQLSQPVIGRQLRFVQIHHQALKTRPILRRGAHPGRKIRADSLAGTMRTTFDLGPMFRHRQESSGKSNTWRLS